MATGNVVEMQEKPKEKTPTGWAKFWQKEMTAANKRMRQFRAQGNSVVDRYLDRRKGGGDDSWFAGAHGVSGPTSRYNLFHTNISTMQSMLYGNIPQIDVSREHNDPDDDVARVAAMLYQRILQADVSVSGERFPTTLKACLLDRLLPGMGIARLRYDFDTTTIVTLDPASLQPVETEQISREDAIVDYVHWQDYTYGWGRTWSEIPWMAFRSFMTKTEAEERFGKKKADELNYENQQPTGSADQKDDILNADQENNVQKAAIWEVWHKKDKRVFWWSKDCDIILDAQDDPLGLDGFWPCPMPMMANLTTSLYIAQADFITAQDLYNEVDILQSRITTITQAVKVVGVYDKGASESVGRMLKEGVENDMIPVDNWAMFSEKGGLAGGIQWFPVEQVVATLKTLQELQIVKVEQLNDVTGMSEIMKGGTGGQYAGNAQVGQAAKMGSIRVQSLQEDFARFASDIAQIRAEIISKHFDEASIMRQSSAQFVPQPDLDKVMPALQLMKSPDIKWRVNIRPESIAMVDYAKLKEERTEFLMAMAQYIQSAQAAAKTMPGSLPVLLELMKWGMSGFKGSDYLEGIMDKAIDMAKNAPPQNEEDPKAKADAAKGQAELQKIQAKSQADMQLVQAKSQADIQKQQADHQQDMAEMQAKGQADLQKIASDLQADMQVIAAKLDADLQVEEAQSTFAIAETEVTNEAATQQVGLEHAAAMAEIRAKPVAPKGGDDD